MEFQRLSAKLASYPVRRWFTREIPNLAKDLRNMLAASSAISSGAIAATGVTVSGAVLQVSTTGPLVAKVNGVLKASLAAVTNIDLFTTAALIGQPIFADGTTAAGIALTANTSAHVTLVAVDSTGAGAFTGDNGALLYVAVVSGGSASFSAQTKPATDAEIRAALLLSVGVHSGATGFVRIADIAWTDTAGVLAAITTPNRDA